MFSFFCALHTQGSLLEFGFFSHGSFTIFGVLFIGYVHLNCLSCSLSNQINFFLNFWSLSFFQVSEVFDKEVLKETQCERLASGNCF